MYFQASNNYELFFLNFCLDQMIKMTKNKHSVYILPKSFFPIPKSGQKVQKNEETNDKKGNKIVSTSKTGSCLATKLDGTSAVLPNIREYIWNIF